MIDDGDLRRLLEDIETARSAGDWYCVDCRRTLDTEARESEHQDHSLLRYFPYEFDDFSGAILVLQGLLRRS